MSEAPDVRAAQRGVEVSESTDCQRRQQHQPPLGASSSPPSPPPPSPLPPWLDFGADKQAAPALTCLLPVELPGGGGKGRCSLDATWLRSCWSPEMKTSWHRQGDAQCHLPVPEPCPPWAGTGSAQPAPGTGKGSWDLTAALCQNRVCLALPTPLPLLQTSPHRVLPTKVLHSPFCGFRKFMNVPGARV